MSGSVGELDLAACAELCRRLPAAASLAVLTSVDSTNRLARRVARAYLDGGRTPPELVLIARRQSAGRGRRGRRWLSPSGQGVYTSLLLSVADAEELAALPLRVPLALVEELAARGVDCRIKWPNDLLFEGRKLGGVLIEALAGPRAVVVGYGLNGSQTEADLPLAGATSLRLASGAPPELSRLAVELAAAVLGGLAARGSMIALVEAYTGRSAHRPGDLLSCRLGDELVEGRFVGFDERGRLRLDAAGGERRLETGELAPAGEEIASVDG